MLTDVIGMLTNMSKVHYYISEGQAKKTIHIELTDLQ